MVREVGGGFDGVGDAAVGVEEAPVTEEADAVLHMGAGAGGSNLVGAAESIGVTKEVGGAGFGWIGEGAADGGVGEFGGGELIQLPGGEAGEAVVHADVVEAELGAGAGQPFRVRPVIAPEELDVFLIEGFGRKEDRSKRLGVAGGVVAQIFDRLAGAVGQVGEVVVQADAVLKTDRVEA